MELAPTGCSGLYISIRGTYLSLLLNNQKALIAINANCPSLSQGILFCSRNPNPFLTKIQDPA